MMIITYRVLDGYILSATWDTDRNKIPVSPYAGEDRILIDELDENRTNKLEKLSQLLFETGANRPRIEGGNIIYNGQVFTFEIDTDKQQFKEEYQLAVDTLQSHIDEVAWTNAKIINAVVFQARVLLFIVKLMRRLVT